MKKTKKKCFACGNNQVNHLETYIQNTLIVYIEPIIQFVMNNSILRFIIKIYISLLLFLFKLIMPILEFFKIIAWNFDVEKADSIRSKVIWEEAIKRKIPMKQMIVLGGCTDIYLAKVKNKEYFFRSLPKPPWLPELGEAWMDDKFILKKKLEAKNIPVPKGGSAVSFNQAIAIFDKINKPVIIKPRLGSRGRHTTTNINTREELKKAFEIAKIISRFVVIEEHIVGAVYRGTTVDGKVVGILEGTPPRITGDGNKNIKELILEKNKNKKDPIKDVIINEYLIEFLKRQNYSLESILEKNKTIDLLEKIGISYGGSSKELFYETHPKIISYLEQAAKVVDTPILGFDFIINNPTSDPDKQHWGIIECNSLPFINLHHFPVEGYSINVAEKVWDLWLK